MKIGFSSALALCLLMRGIGAACAAADYPEYEIWFGAGSARSFERNIFNTPNAIASRPEVLGSIGYIRNLDARRALGLQIYGTAETIPSSVLPGPGGVPLGPFDLSTGTVGLRYRHTFNRATLSPYLFVGAGWSSAILESDATGELQYQGISLCAGPGASVRLGRHFMLSAEGMGSFGWGKWKTRPLPGSSGREFEPSTAGGTVHLSFVWGDRPVSVPASDTLAIRDSSLALAGPDRDRTWPSLPVFLIGETCIALISSPAFADDRGRSLAGVTIASALLGAAADESQSPKSFRIMFFGLLGLAATEFAIGRAGASPAALFWTSAISWNVLGFFSSRADRQAKSRR